MIFRLIHLYTHTTNTTTILKDIKQSKEVVNNMKIKLSKDDLLFGIKQ